ncbi:Hypothetical protein A7982_03927 [Minicystis rosea]|nr:Hypothetical protein A7982_03927 [Minicystis rosea]
MAHLLAREETMMTKTIEEIRAALVRSNVGFGRPYSEGPSDFP